MMGSMNNATTSRPSAEPGRDDSSAASEQLTLLPSHLVSPRFQLSKDTRERGLRHVAEIRQMLAQRSTGHGQAA